MVFINKLQQYAEAKPQKIAFRYLDHTGSEVESVTFKELNEKAICRARSISLFAKSGDRVVLLHSSGIEYITTMLGCLMLGVVAVPLYPPRKNSRTERVEEVITSCDAVAALTNSEQLAAVESLIDTCRLMRPVSVYASDSMKGSTNKNINDNESGDIAVLQFTSGSTGIPKGVIVTHDNIEANVEALIAAADVTSADEFVNWLPLYHDLGMITTIFLPLYIGATSTLMAPATFVKSPSVWLKSITKYKGTIAGAPNFAFDLCVKKSREEASSLIDLSSWRVAFNAAEPVRLETLSSFHDKYKSYGFTWSSFFPAYGLAEATAFVTGSLKSGGPSVLTVDLESLQNREVVPISRSAQANTGKNIHLVGNGRVSKNHFINICGLGNQVDATNTLIGEIEICGPSVSPGYWTKSASDEQLDGGMFNAGENSTKTGDLGFISGQELFVVGRISDLIIVNGKNYYPQNIEHTVAQVSEVLRDGACVAFGLEEEGNASLGLVVELEREFYRRTNFELLTAEIKEKVFLDFGIGVSKIAFLAPLSLPMTSSGKVQRRKTKDRMINDCLQGVLHYSQASPAESVLPRSEIEETLYRLWSDVIRDFRFGVTDNIFTLGIDSIQIFDIHNKIIVYYENIEFPSDFAYEYSSIESLAAYIESNSATKSPEGGEDVVSVKRKKIQI